MLTITVEPDTSFMYDHSKKLSTSVLNIVWMTEDTLPAIAENAIIGYVLARISIDGAHFDKKR